MAAAGQVAGSAAVGTVGYQSTDLVVGGRRVPLAIWYPVSPVAAAGTADLDAPSPYEYKISIAKIVKLFLGISLPAWLARKFLLRSRCHVVTGSPRPTAASSPAVIFAHGYLGSRFDMLHLAELLVQQGFVVAAPEFAESLSASFEASEGTSREAIMQEALQVLRKDFQADRVGLIGHSAGGGTVSRQPGRFALGRVVVAGGGLNYQGTDPLLVVASQGDTFFASYWDQFRNILKDPVSGAALFEGAAGAAQLATAPVRSLRSRSALLFEFEGNGPPRPPSHISFLDPRSNSAMVEFLSPLLPIARLLRVPVLDFDVYQKHQDSDSTAAMVLPAVARFFANNLCAAEGAAGSSKCST